MKYINCKVGSSSCSNKRRWNTFNKFIDIYAQVVGASAGLVWLTLFRYANNTGEVQLAVSRITDLTGLSKRTVMASLKKLEDARLVRTKKQGGPNVGITVYSITVKPELLPLEN